MVHTHRVMRSWARLPKRMGAGSVPAEAIGRAVYAIPRTELSRKPLIFRQKAKYEGALRVYSRGAFSYCVFCRALSGAS